MNRFTRSAMVLPAMVLLALAAGGTAAAASGSSARSGGPDATYGNANPFAGATASVHVVRTGAGGMKVSLHVRHVDAVTGRVFGAHVHQKPCGPSGADAGGHYVHPGVTGSLEDREVWLDFSVNAAGNGHARAVRAWSLDESTPRSVVIHALSTAPETGVAGARLACIDLDGQG